MTPRLLTIAVVTGCLVRLPQPVAAQPVNDRVLRFSRDRLGKKVGDGQCAALGTEALGAARALTNFPDHPHKGDYVWGENVYTMEAEGMGKKEIKKLGTAGAIRPGDVVQFRNSRFLSEGGADRVYSRHTAVVQAMNAKTGEITVLEQNFNGNKFVTRDTFNLNDLKRGWLRVYRPVPKKGNKQG